MPNLIVYWQNKVDLESIAWLIPPYPAYAQGHYLNVFTRDKYNLWVSPADPGAPAIVWKVVLNASSNVGALAVAGYDWTSYEAGGLPGSVKVYGSGDGGSTFGSVLAELTQLQIVAGRGFAVTDFAAPVSWGTWKIEVTLQSGLENAQYAIARLMLLSKWDSGIVWAPGTSGASVLPQVQSPMADDTPMVTVTGVARKEWRLSLSKVPATTKAPWEAIVEDGRPFFIVDNMGLPHYVIPKTGRVDWTHIAGAGSVANYYDMTVELVELP